MVGNIKAPKANRKKEDGGMTEVHGNITFLDDHVEIVLSPKIYPLDVVFSAAYILMDRAYIVIDGDPEKEIIARIMAKPRGGKGVLLSALADDFNNELLNYSVYRAGVEQRSGIRLALVERALKTTLSCKMGVGEDESDANREKLEFPWGDND